MIPPRDRLRPLLAAPLLLAAGCSFSYDNPAQDLGTGEVAGRVVVDAAGTGALSGVAGVRVELRNSYNLVTTRDTGNFFLFGMMPGRHTVLLSKAPDLALQRDVEMTWGKDGQPEGVVLGDLRLRRAVTLQGRVAAPSLNSLLAQGYTGFDAGGGLATVTDEATGQRFEAVLDAGSDGSFDFTLEGAPTGRHVLRAAVTGTLLIYDPILGFPNVIAAGLGTVVGDALVIDVPDASEGLKLSVTDTVPALPPALATGKLRFQAAVAGASSGLAFDVSVLQLGAGTPPTTPTPDSTGTYELDLPPGRYQVLVQLPAGYVGPLLPPPPGQGVVSDGQTTELGAFYAVDTAVLSASSQACLTTADCLDGTCQGGTCVLVPCLAGDYSVACASAISSCSAAAPVTCAGGAGICGGFSVDLVCVPKGASACTQGGSTYSACTVRPN